MKRDTKKRAALFTLYALFVILLLLGTRCESRPHLTTPERDAKHHKVLGNALQGYKKINARAMEKIRPGGILFTFSCSQAVSRELFRTTIFTAAAIARRKVRIIGQLTQPADHPINIYHPEGEYLKGLVVYVE